MTKPIGTPFNYRVPKDVVGNLKWRSEVHARVLKDDGYAVAIRDACAADPLFYLNGFGYTHDPRREPFTKLPFILYPFQEEVIREIIHVIGKEDLLIEKSRDMGASWMCVAAVNWCWMFKTLQSFLFVSRVEDYVDKAGNPKALFWKFDYLLNNLPLWLQPEGYNENEHRRNLHIENPATGSVVDGESTTKRTARGDRRTAILLDEFAAVDMGYKVLSATRDATNCRIFNSTPEGVNNAFHDMRQSGIRKLRIHWPDHPLKSVGLYTRRNDGEYETIDKGYWSDCADPRSVMAEYDEKIISRGVPLPNNKMRSPWYANECIRAASAQEIAQELDIDYRGSGFQYFNAIAINESIRKYARPPLLIGDIDYDELTAEPVGFRENNSGRVKLWCLLNVNDKPPEDQKYSVGVDVSAGTGASNSVISAWNTVTMEKILEYANPCIRPEALARQAVAICKWLGNARLIWERNGVGRQFGGRVMELGYSNVYLGRREEAISKKVSDIPGWAATKETKLVLLGSYRAAIEKDGCINRSKPAMEETLEYVFTSDGGVIHSRAASKTDPSGAKTNHGDRVIADALAYKMITDCVRPPVDTAPTVPAGCLKWRQNMRAEAKKEKALDGW